MKSSSRFVTACLLLLLAGYGDKAKDFYNPAQLEEKQFNKPHATKLYWQIVEEYPNSPYANQAKIRWPSWRKRVRLSSSTPPLCSPIEALTGQVVLNLSKRSRSCLLASPER